MVAQYAREAVSDQCMIIDEQHANAELVVERIALSTALRTASERRLLARNF
jgi:hypothetical protein